MRRHLILVAAALSAAALPASASGQDAATKPCPDVAGGARCVTFDTALDHSGATAGTQRLGFAIVPATGTRQGTLAVLAGGPGQSATALGPEITELLAPIRKTYDLLLVDERGTGISGALHCPGLTSSESAGAITKCADSLGPARAFYNAAEDAADLDAIRAVAGLDKLSVLGVSSGGRVAGVYARAFPDRVDRVVLDSPEPVEGFDALMAPRQLALPRVLREVCFPAGCQGFLAGDPLKGVATLARRLRTHRLSGTVISPHGRPKPAHLSSTGFYALTSISDLDPYIRTRLPSAVAAALRGDTAPLLRLSSTGGPAETSGESVNAARLLASDCIDIRQPWDPASDPASRRAALASALRARPTRAFAPFSRVDVAALSPAATCLDWPATPAPPRTGGPGPAVPVLVISGRDDLRTPLEDARRTASQYPDGQVLAVPGTGHSVLGGDPSGCALEGLTKFLQGQTVSHCRVMPRLPALFPYVPANAAKLPAASGLKGAIGRTATALGVTLSDALRAAADTGIGRVGGLRAGTMTVALTGLRLQGYSLVRGVAVSGTIPLSLGKSGTITVTGPAAVAGRFTIRGPRLSGTLGGKRVRMIVSLD